MTWGTALTLLPQELAMRAAWLHELQFATLDIYTPVLVCQTSDSMLEVLFSLEA
jgi:hypothetical protein